MTNFEKVNPKQSFPEIEENIIKFWKENDTFKKSIENRANSEEFNFYDGPPFATGTPHYGHILAGAIKDVIPRYQTMKGKKVERKFGWDTHGLPIENIVEKKLEISGKEDIENKIGVHCFNETCRENVFGFVDEWKTTVERMGRWVDMENDYKTMDTNFMESVWWVYKTIYDKGLIYEGNRIVPYCPRCTTPLSNFEVNQGYKDKQDKTVTVKFKVNNGEHKKNYKISTGIIVKNEDGKILFGKRKTNGLLTLAGGKLENGETPKECAIRELKEETGIKTSDLDLYSCNFSYHNSQDWKEYIYILNIKNNISIQNSEKDKFENWNFYDIYELKNENIESYDHQIIKQIKGEKEINKYHKNGEKYLLAWTTTPWTLYANLGLAVGEDILYSEILDKNNGDTYVIASDLVKNYYKQPKETGLKKRPVSEETEDYKIIREYKGSCLVGIKYEPLFDDFKIQLEDMEADLGTGINLGKNSYSVVIGHHVTTESGTGIVHIAPAYGEDDNIIGKEKDLGFVAHINDAGKTYNLLDENKNNKFIFEFNEEVISELKEKKVAVLISTINHSYPHCWRCDTPLIYRAISAWYVDVTAIKDKMIANNQKINWVPDEIKNGRMGKWLEGARDWNISRNRYWGSAIPVWQSPDKKEEVCVGSIEELYELNKDFGQITKVIFLRHGETDYNLEQRLDSKGKAKLTEKGINQAKNIANTFKNTHIDYIISSPINRCIETIDYLAKEKNIKIIEDDRLKESFFGDLEGKIVDDNFLTRYQEKTKQIGGNGETIESIEKRIEEFYKEIPKKYKGKTIVICSHGDELVKLLSLINGKEFSKNNFMEIYSEVNNENRFKEKYIYTNTGKEIDLHKHFVDEILVKNEKNFVAKNVLGIHGRQSHITKDSWKNRQKIAKKNGMNLDLFQFNNSYDPSYESWKTTFNTIDFSKYDTIYTNSLGGAMTIQYLLENNIKIKRLVAVCPGKGITLNKDRENLYNFYNKLYSKNLDLKNLVEDIIVIHAKNDEKVSFEEGKIFANKIGATFIELNDGGHKLEKYYNFISNIIKHGTPLKRIPEVLDCWFESGSMPYASKHYIGENIENFKFPADFIAEGLDQTRGWFYTLLILGTALFDNTPFLNCIVNGIVLAEDGKKMSKSLKNYPDPKHIFNDYGADAMRFYLLNSPVVEADDFRFSEAGVEEVVKKVILPLWNTYYFFTTYANIDNFETKNNIYFVRHGETDNNKFHRVNGGENDIDINENGINQAHKTGKLLQSKNLKIDKIICSPMQRAKHTAEIIKSYIGDITIEIKEDLKERDYGDFGGKTFDEIAKTYNLENENKTIRRYVLNNSKENLKDFIIRNKNILNKIRTEEKNILIIGHSGNYKAMLNENNPNIDIDNYIATNTPQNADFFTITKQKSNKLDSWLISELNELTKEVSKGFDSYKLRNASTPIVKFMDNLTNWYIRRSRKRFWKSENDGDKIEAYETLYFVLIELTKIIAPFMPFVSEHIYKNLTGNESVHLEDFPTYNKNLIDEKLNAQTDKIQKIITLGLAFRANQKIRVRQPLQSLTITEDFEEYFKEILKEELNVKEILVINGETLAKKVCKPNGRNIGPKFGKDVKFIMTEAKSGNFEELENGNVKVGDFELEVGDFELVFEAEDSEKLIETGFGMVISMDTNITENLKQEGFARDLVRHIQEARKEADYNVEDRISLELKTENLELKKTIESFGKYIETETLSHLKESLERSDFKKEVEIEGEKVEISLKK